MEGSVQFPWIDAAIADVPADYDAELSPVEENEVVIGTVPDRLRRLNNAFGNLVRTINTKGKEHLTADHKHGGEECAKWRLEMAELAYRVDIMKSLFFATLKIELGIEPCNMGIRENWQVVRMPDKDEDDESPIGASVVVMTGMFGDVLGRVLRG